MLGLPCRGGSPMHMNCFSWRLFCSSSPLVPQSLPSRRETHFWYVVPDEVKDTSLLNRYLDLLSPCEKVNVFQMRGEKLQKGALLARTLVRTTLARYTNSQASPRSLKFKKNAFGKPEIVWQHNEIWDPPSLHFNISHTSSLIACAVTLDVPIGIDVEEKQRKTRNNPLSFARRYFSSHEVECLHAITDPEIQQREFIKLWTLKEAYVKALGRGFSAAPFKTFTIRLSSNSKFGVQLPEHSFSEDFEVSVEGLDDPDYMTTDWRFGLFELASSHYVALCVKKDAAIEGEAIKPLELKVWRTIPFVEDKCVSGTDSVLTISGLA